jgi:hypothetical protein
METAFNSSYQVCVDNWGSSAPVLRASHGKAAITDLQFNQVQYEDEFMAQKMILGSFHTFNY